MNKMLKYTLLLGVALSCCVGGQVMAQTTIGSEIGGRIAAGQNKYAAIKRFVEKVTEDRWPVLDVTSIPTHAIVATEQEFSRLRTEVEKDVKGQIREKLSVPKKKINGMMKEIDAKLSNVEVKTCGITEKAGDGMVGKGKDEEIIKDGGKTTYALAQEQQKDYTSSAGTMNEKEAYLQQRKYTEQEQAIRLLALATVLRKNVLDTVGSVIDDVDSKYNESETSKDLDPNNKKKTVEKNNDYNQTLRLYAHHGLAYDQLLSLEQQILGLRLQTKGGLYEQGTTPLSDVLDVKGQQ